MRGCFSLLPSVLNIHTNMSFMSAPFCGLWLNILESHQWQMLLVIFALAVALRSKVAAPFMDCLTFTIVPPCLGARALRLPFKGWEKPELSRSPRAQQNASSKWAFVHFPSDFVMFNRNKAWTVISRISFKIWLKLLFRWKVRIILTHKTTYYL